MRNRSVIHRASCFAALLVTFATTVTLAQAKRHTPLSSADVDEIALLEQLEDRRQFDSVALARILVAPHPELRRRAAMSIARIADKRGIALLRSVPLDADTAVAASEVFAVGQLRDTMTVAWFDTLLMNPKLAPTVAVEAVVALGKLKTAAARATLAGYLTRTPSSPRTVDAIGDALLSIGRSTARGDVAPIVKWTMSPNEETRWRATWALYRQRDPAATRALLKLAHDKSAHVRSWAVRGLTKAQADSAHLADDAELALLNATRDNDRRVKTEAVRALATYQDSLSVRAHIDALASVDTWVAVVAAEGLGRLRVSGTIRQLVDATSEHRPCTVRVSAMQALLTFAQSDAMNSAIDMTHDKVALCRQLAIQTLARDTSEVSARATALSIVDQFRADTSSAMRAVAWQAHWVLTDAGIDLTTRRASRLANASMVDVFARSGALRSMTQWADSTDLPLLFDSYARAINDPNPAAASAAVAAIGAVQRRQNVGASAFLARFTPPADRNLRRDIDRTLGAVVRQAWPAAPVSTKTLAEYRGIVERWVVPEYNGAPHPTARWETPRGPITLELYPGDTPLAVDDFVRTTVSGTIVGTIFTRVVPDFVDQEQPVRDGTVLRDEVNRHRLTRGNLAWATAGLDTGTPGYTLNHTPQPHNEGDFTSMGRVIDGQTAADRIELGDTILGAKMLSAGKH